MSKGKEKLAKIIAKRDGYTLAEARELVKECEEELLGGNEYALEDILGLEDDYIYDLLM